MASRTPIITKAVLVRTALYLLAVVTGVLASIYLFPLIQKIRQERQQATIVSKSNIGIYYAHTVMGMILQRS